mmetsp:Transcript_35958/g.56118  ORF Transcript_35958/g.56118 Transcript_35958/m.56118 type:complete len:95 (+) Transcript_35958:88-372(+)
MFYAAMYALKGREERRNSTALSQLSSFSDLGGRPETERASYPRTQLAERGGSLPSTAVPAIPDCGLFGTTCDGNTYLQGAIPSMRTPKTAHLSP